MLETVKKLGVPKGTKNFLTWMKYNLSVKLLFKLPSSVSITRQWEYHKAIKVVRFCMKCSSHHYKNPIIVILLDTWISAKKTFLNASVVLSFQNFQKYSLQYKVEYNLFFTTNLCSSFLCTFTLLSSSWTERVFGVSLQVKWSHKN